MQVKDAVISTNLLVLKRTSRIGTSVQWSVFLAIAIVMMVSVRQLIQTATALSELIRFVELMGLLITTSVCWSVTGCRKRRTVLVIRLVTVQTLTRLSVAVMGRHTKTDVNWTVSVWELTTTAHVIIKAQIPVVVLL